MKKLKYIEQNSNFFYFDKLTLSKEKIIFNKAFQIRRIGFAWQNVLMRSQITINWFINWLKFNKTEFWRTKLDNVKFVRNKNYISSIIYSDFFLYKNYTKIDLIKTFASTIHNKILTQNSSP